MSQIVNALKKVLEIRQNDQRTKGMETLQTAFGRQTALKSVLMFLLGAGVAVVILIIMAASRGSNPGADQKEIQDLEKTIKVQEKNINDLKKETRKINIRINNLASKENDHYGNLKEAILDDKQQIDFLDKYTKNLNKQ